MTGRATADLVDIDNLSVSFATDAGTVAAVKGVSLSVGAGEVLAIVGESGSGKTVTARSILGLLPETATTRGAVLLTSKDGGSTHDVVTLTGARLGDVRGRDAAMVFQEPSTALNPVYKVGWQIAEGLRAHGKYSKKEARAKAIDVLRRVGIPDPEHRVDHYPHQFSGGQKQRIVIAQALVLDPGVIIADEPTTALDVTVQAEILDLLRRCRDEFGTAIVLITHNMGVVADLADRVAVMYQGEIVEEADVRTLFSTPQDPYTPAAARRGARGSGTGCCPHRASGPRHGRRAGRRRHPSSRRRTCGSSTRVGCAQPDFVAVDGVSFEIRPGEVLGLVGESGSGKTTIGRAIAGLTKVTGGSLQVLGAEMNGVKERSFRPVRERIGFVFQDPASSFNPLLTIADAVAEPLVVHKRADDPQDARGAGRRAARGRAAAQVVRRPVPARALRRPAAARQPGPLAGAEPRAADRRRADVRPRRLGAGAGAGAVRRDPARVRLRGAVHQPRPRRRRPARRPDRRPLQGQAGRGGHGARGAGRAAAPVHAAAAGLAARARPGRAGDPPRRSGTTCGRRTS